MIARTEFQSQILRALKRSAICALLGPRQCGKTTLAKSIGEEQQSHYFDLESPKDQLRIQNPEQSLSRLEGLIILDEIQTMPELFGILRVLADREGAKAHFLILGSASPELIRRSADSLAGRIEFVDLHGFSISEVGTDSVNELWTRGGFPRSFLAPSEEDSVAWREGFLRTFLERDLPQFGIQTSPLVMRRFWTMLAHSHGQLWNASQLSRSLGLTDKTVKSYLNTLTDTFMVRQLQPWFENLKKRQVKSPKIYLRDSGLLHHLLSLESTHALHSHPQVGASWEGFALEQILRYHDTRDAYFWATQSGAELDLLIFKNGKRLGYQFKYAEKLAVTKSMRIALTDLKLDALTIVCPTDIEAPLDDRISVSSLEHIVK
jgi:hypothetical protein